MHNNFDVLHSKCKRYHLKKLLKLVVPITILGLVIVVSLLYPFKNSEDVKRVEIDIPKAAEDADIFIDVKESIPKKTKPSVEEIIVEEPDIFQETKKDSKQKIEDVEYNLHLYSYNLLNKKREKIIHRKIVKKKNIEHKSKEIKQKVIEKVHKIESKPKDTDKSFSIVLKNINSTDKMIEVYNREQTYSIALKIAKLFFKQKKYKDALAWSKKANNINSREEEAWLIYAKSEYALGHEKRAKAVLKIYINNSNSKKANSLLISWLKGTNNG